uniref:Uncharacterized protein n=1 Tax=Cucumis melo TaxID=3656 RepID=A0A9I9E5E4_CUCME
MDEQKGHETACIQFPQKFHNVTKNEIYGSSLRVMNEVEFPGVDDFGGPRYHGLGCFHKREMGLRYGCVVEDGMTELSIRRQELKSTYCNPKREAFLRVWSGKDWVGLRMFCNGYLRGQAASKLNVSPLSNLINWYQSDVKSWENSFGTDAITMAHQDKL